MQCRFLSPYDWEFRFSAALCRPSLSELLCLMVYRGTIDGKPFSAQKPFVAIGWPHNEPVVMFDRKRQLCRFINAIAKRDPTVLFGRAYQFKAGEWQLVPLPCKD